MNHMIDGQARALTRLFPVEKARFHTALEGAFHVGRQRISDHQNFGGENFAIFAQLFILIQCFHAVIKKLSGWFGKSDLSGGENFGKL